VVVVQGAGPIGMGGFHAHESLEAMIAGVLPNK